jgi:hypothetical protein
MAVQIIQNVSGRDGKNRKLVINYIFYEKK